jgi:Zn-dependent protease with chaperone function
MANNAKTVALLALLGGLFVGAGWFLFGQQGALIALGIAVVINFAMSFFSDKIAIKAARGPLDRPQPSTNPTVARHSVA